MAVSKTVLVIALIIGSTLSSQTTKKTSPTTGRTNMSSTRRTSPSSRSSTASPYNPAANYYYMDSSGECNSYNTESFYKKSGALYVKPWGSRTHNARAGGCTFTFSSYSYYGMKFRFTSLGYIRDCSVKLNIYSGSSTFGTPMVTYSCGKPPSSSYYQVYGGTITVELVNPYLLNDFDFTLYATSYDTYHESGGEIAGICVGVFVAVLIFVCVSIIVCRRRRARVIRGPPLITTTTSTYTYPSGQTAYPPPPASYGSVPYSPPGSGYPAGAAPYHQPPPPSYNQPPPPPVYNN